MLTAAKKAPSREDIFIGLFLIFSFWPIREVLHLGQVCFLTTFFMAVSVYFMKRERWLLAGIALSLAILTKEYLVISLLAFVWKRNWKTLAGVMLGVFLVKLTGILVHGWPTELAYWKYIFGFGGNFHSSINNHSLTSTIYRIVGQPAGIPFCRVLSLSIGSILICLALFWTRRTADMALSFFPFLALSFILPPWIHETHYIILYPAIIALWFSLDAGERYVDYALFIAMYLLLGLRYSLISFPAFHSGALALFTAGKLAGIIAFFVLAGRIASRPDYALRK